MRTSNCLLSSFGILTAATGVVDAIESVGGNLCDTDDERVIVHEIVSSKDATIFQGQATISAGEDLFMTGTTKNGIRRGLLAFTFNKDDFPNDAQVECTEIRLHVAPSDHSVEVPEINLHRITSAWETTGSNRLTNLNGGAANQHDTTWTHADYPRSTWQDQGGDFADDIVATKFAAGDIHSFGNTLIMARLVQEWIDVGSDPFNAGFMLIGEENASSDKYVRYNGIENAPSLIPRLIVTYTSPSQGKDHRDYTGYMSISNSSGFKDNGEEASNDLWFYALLVFGGFVVGAVFGGLVVYFISLRRKRSQGRIERTFKSEGKSDRKTMECDASTSEIDFQLAKQGIVAKEETSDEIGALA